MIELTVKVEGLQEVEDALAQAGPKLARRAMRKALTDGGQLFLDRAKARCPILQHPTTERQGGELRAALDMRVTLSAKQESGRARIGIKHDQGKGSQSPAVYGLFVELGSVHNSPQPYMRPAYDSGKQEAADVFTATIRDSVDSLKK